MPDTDESGCSLQELIDASIRAQPGKAGQSPQRRVAIEHRIHALLRTAPHPSI